MTLGQIIDQYKCNVYSRTPFNTEKEIRYAFCSDLMSDALMIMSTVRESGILEDSVLITGLATNQSIRTAEMLDVQIVCLVRGKIPAQQVIDLADESGITLLGTELTMFNLSGRLYQEGVVGIASKK